jgi:hypothetical protein
MGSTADIEIDWGDGRYLFSLRIGQIPELQEKCGDPNRLDGTIKLSGPPEIVLRLSVGAWRLNDVRETIRLALIGGGKTPVEALTLVKRYVDARPLNENVLVAQAILLKALNGPPEEATEKKDDAETATAATASSTSEASTGGAVH